MKYTKHVKLSTIMDKYKYIIAWGGGALLEQNYKKGYYDVDFIIDGKGHNIGKFYDGTEIKNESSIKELDGKILIIVYTIYEAEILQQLNKYSDKDIDTIIFSLLDIEMSNSNIISHINAKSAEDYLILMLCRQLNLASIQFLEIGVCHPIIRNNTYLLNEQFSSNKNYKGILVEANPLCWNLIEEYRPNDRLIKCGVSTESDTGKKIFYAFPNLLGHSTFIKEIAIQKIKEGVKCAQIAVPVKSINQIINENFKQVPDLLALDAEGLDLSILESWDSDRYPFKMLITEIGEDSKEQILNLMKEKGYKIYAQTLENIIWVRDKYKMLI